MKLIRTANGNKLKITREEWEKIGREAKWNKKDVVDPKEKGKWEGYTQEELKSKLSKAKERQRKRKEKGNKADPKDTELIRELNFALRAKTGWGKVK